MNIREFEFTEQGVKVHALFYRSDSFRTLPNKKVRFRKAITCELLIDELKHVHESICRPGDKFDIKLGMLTALKKCISEAGKYDCSKPKLEKIVPWLLIWHNHHKGLKKKEKKIAKKAKEQEYAKSIGIPFVKNPGGDV